MLNNNHPFSLFKVGRASDYLPVLLDLGTYIYMYVYIYMCECVYVCVDMSSCVR